MQINFVSVKLLFINVDKFCKKTARRFDRNFLTVLANERVKW